MRKLRIFLVLVCLMLLAALAVGVSLTALAVVDSDWIAAPSKTLTKCPGDGSCDHTDGKCDYDYAYSFAVVGDTQNLNYIDAQNYVNALANDQSLTCAGYTQAYMRTLYKWILDNKDAYNIQYVLGVGDVTQSYNVNQTYYYEEWALAKEAISILDGEIGYSLVRGNHDISSGMNGAFGKGNTYYTDLVALSEKDDDNGRPMAGFLNTDKIEDTYRKITTSDGDKYIIFTLDYYPTETCLDWLDDILYENSDYTAIITVHAFINDSVDLLDDIDTTTPAEVTGNWTGIATGGNVEPRVLWEEHLSKHANVKLITCGHIALDGVVINQLRGDNGNTVTALLTNGQSVDKYYEPVGLVTMLYFSADGKVVNVEHISTVRDAANEGLPSDDENFKPAYLGEDNQFSFIADYSNEYEETEYGYIPTELYNEYPFHVLLDDDGDVSTDPAYFGYFETWADTLAEIHKWNDSGSGDARELKTWNIVLTSNYEQSSMPSNKSGLNPGTMVLDLNGKTFKVKSSTAIPYYNDKAAYRPSVVVKNGTLELAGGTLAALQCSVESNSSVIDLALSGLDIKITSASSSIVTTYGGSNTYKSLVYLDVEDCDIDTSSAGGVVTLFKLKHSNGYNSTHIIVTLKGGSIVADTVSNLTVAELDQGYDKVLYAQGADESYPTLTLNEGADLTGVYRTPDGALLRYTTSSTAAPYVYTMEQAPIEETVYGNIPTDAYPAESYPFALFQNGELAAAYPTWYDFCQKIYSFDTKETNNTVLYLRGDITVDETSNQLRNVKYLTIDLGEHTVTAEAVLFNYMAQNNYSFTTNIKVKGGTVVQSKAWAPLIAYNSANTTEVECCFNMTFDDVTVKSDSDFQGRLLIEAWSNGTYGTKNSAVFNDCIFDVTTGTVSKLFQLEESNSQNKVDVAVSFNGGKLLTNSYFTLGSFSDERESGKGSPDTLTIDKDFALVMPSTVAHPTSGITTTEGELYPIETVDDDTNATYYFKSIVTKYGTISTANLSAVDYPFVLFKNDEQIHAAQSWYTFIQSTIVQNSDFRTGGTLLVRRDYNTTEAANSSQNLYYIQDLTVDLNGYTLTRGSYHLFQAMEKHTTERRIGITVKNGTLVSNGAPVISFNDHSTSTVVSGYDFIFENVTFNLSAGKSLVNCFKDGDEGMINTVTLNDCTIDIGSYTNALTIFALAESSGNKQDVSVVINGGEIRASSFANVTLATFSTEREEGKGSPDTLKHGVNTNNAYVRYVSAAGAAAPAYTYTAVNGASLSLRDDSTADAAIFQLGEDVKCDYGTIPFKYADKDKHPIVLFTDGEATSGESVFSTAYATARSKAKANAETVSVLYMRKDLTETLTENLADNEGIKGTLIIDLGGNTYTASGKALFKFNAKENSNKPVIVVTNGVINSRRLLQFATQNKTENSNSTDYNISFTNMTLGLTSDAWNYMVAMDTGNSWAGFYSHASLVFDNCVFDLKTNESFDSYCLMNIGGDNDNHATDIIIKGCEFIIGDYSFTLAATNSGYSDNENFIEGNNDGDTVKFEKGANGYARFIYPKSATAPTNVYDSTELAFVKLTADTDTVTYGLLPKAIAEFKPGTSITLDANLIFNVYIPENGYLTEITLDGKTYEIGDLTATDGKYRLTVELPAAEAGRDIPLTVTFGDEASASYTLSTLKYAEKLLASSTSTKEKALVCDMLAYVKSAYAYFAETDAEKATATEVASAIDALIGTGATKFEKISDTNGSMEVGAGVNGVTFILDAEPRIRFYLAEGTDLANYSFRIGGVAQEYTATEEKVGETNFVCADISLYAYKMIGTVEVYNGSTKLGSFHINDYYDFALTQNNSALVEVVERFYTYCKSAGAYRDEVIAKG